MDTNKTTNAPKSNVRFSAKTRWIKYPHSINPDWGGHACVLGCGFVALCLGGVAIWGGLTTDHEDLILLGGMVTGTGAIAVIVASVLICRVCCSRKTRIQNLPASGDDNAGYMMPNIDVNQHAKAPPKNNMYSGDSKQEITVNSRPTGAEMQQPDLTKIYENGHTDLNSDKPNLVLPNSPIYGVYNNSDAVFSVTVQPIRVLAS